MTLSRTKTSPKYLHPKHIAAWTQCGHRAWSTWGTLMIPSLLESKLGAAMSAKKSWNSIRDALTWMPRAASKAEMQGIQDLLAFAQKLWKLHDCREIHPLNFTRESPLGIAVGGEGLYGSYDGEGRAWLHVFADPLSPEVDAWRWVLEEFPNATLMCIYVRGGRVCIEDAPQNLPCSTPYWVSMLEQGLFPRLPHPSSCTGCPVAKTCRRLP